MGCCRRERKRKLRIVQLLMIFSFFSTKTEVQYRLSASVGSGARMHTTVRTGALVFGRRLHYCPDNRVTQPLSIGCATARNRSFVF